MLLVRDDLRVPSPLDAASPFAQRCVLVLAARSPHVLASLSTGFLARTTLVVIVVEATFVALLTLHLTYLLPAAASVSPANHRRDWFPRTLFECSERRERSVSASKGIIISLITFVDRYYPTFSTSLTLGRCIERNFIIPATLIGEFFSSVKHTA